MHICSPYTRETCTRHDLITFIISGSIAECVNPRETSCIKYNLLRTKRGCSKMAQVIFSRVQTLHFLSLKYTRTPMVRLNVTNLILTNHFRVFPYTFLLTVWIIFHYILLQNTSYTYLYICSIVIQCIYCFIT